MIKFLFYLHVTERPDIRSQFNSVLYQLLLDPSERVCFEAILCVLGKYDNTERCDLCHIMIASILSCYHKSLIGQVINSVKVLTVF